MMKKGLNDYSLYVFDVDGTLYDQPKLRMIMALRLMGYYILHLFSIRDVLILRRFRKVKDSWTMSSSEEDIIKKTAADMNTDAGRVGRIVRKWIYDSPLDVVAKTGDAALAAWIGKLRAMGRKVVILSDYPAVDKLKVLAIEADAVYDPTDPRIDALKPSPKGLFVIMEDTKVPADEILMIGDRQEKDGECAIAAGTDFLILDRHVSKRDIHEE